MIDSEYNIILAFLISLLISYTLIPRLIRIADKYRLSDVAGRRASHQGSTPIFGGVAFFFGLISSLLLFGNFAESYIIIISLIIVFFVGMLDDLLGLTPLKKLLGQILAILIIIYFAGLKIESFHGVLGIDILPDYVSVLFTIFVFIVIINGVNLIDGVDGLASGVGAIAAFSFGSIAYLMGNVEITILAFSLFGSLVSFLRYNFHPAKIFMGDTGSLLIGLVLSILAVNLINTGIIIETMSFPNKGPFLSIVFLSIPLFDSFRVFFARVIKGAHPLHPGRGHIHHALLDLGVGHKNTSLLLYLISIILIFASFFFLDLNINTSIALFAAINFSVLLIPFYILKYRSKK